MAGTALPTAEFAQVDHAAAGRQRLVRLAGRYSLSAIGPIAVSGAHFAASLIFLHKLPPADFGLFSFLLVVVPFCLSISSGLLGAPLVSAIGKAKAVAEDQLAAFRKVNLIFCIAAGVATALLMATSHAGLTAALVFGFYGAVMSLRWFARFNAYIANHPRRAAASDLIYSLSVLAGLAALIATGRLTLVNASMVLLFCSILSVPAFGWSFLRDQFDPKALGSFAAYRPIWRDVTRWSLMGVVLSEMTANAHAYFVTFLSGPKAFALLALGSLLMRPVSLVLQALPDRERPAMARSIAAGDIERAGKSVGEFRFAAGAVWLATIALACVILTWFPQLLLKKGYDADAALIVIAIWALIMAVRALRTPQAVFLQAAGAFHPLARAGMTSSFVSLAGTLALLLLAGPVASLGGILAGELAMTFSVAALMRSWKRAHA